MAIIECRSCGHIVTVDHVDKVPQACPACGSRTTRLAVRKEDLSEDDIERILDSVPAARLEPGDELPEDR